jgi:hypothetical protein
MIPNVQGLQKLADDYLSFLLMRDAMRLAPYLSLDFVRRQRIVSQIRLIGELPQLIFGVGLEASIRENYQPIAYQSSFVICPFQFDIASASTSFIEPDRTTITLHSLILEDGEWKLDAIVTGDDVQVLQQLVARLKKYPEGAQMPAGL